MWNHARWYVREVLAAVLFLLAAGIGLSLYYSQRPSFRKELLITGGSAGGSRAQIALCLARVARVDGLRLRVVDCEGSKQALEWLDRGQLDLALVQGGLDPEAYPHVRQVAALHVEPLHLLVKPARYQSTREHLASLRGAMVNLSTPESGTHDLALEVLRFAGLRPRMPDGTGDFAVSSLSYQEIREQADPGKLPDAVFTVSDLPSPVAHLLVSRHHFQLVPLPFGEAFALGNFGDRQRERMGDDVADITRFTIYPTVIPPFTYGIDAPCPAEPLATFGPRLLLVAQQSVPPHAVRLVLETLLSSRFAPYYHPILDPSLLDAPPEYPWHAGTDEYRQYHKPVLAGEVVDLMEKATSLTGAVLALFSSCGSGSASTCAASGSWASSRTC